jgi:Ni/Co efflux regulator RcnB
MPIFVLGLAAAMPAAAWAQTDEHRDDQNTSQPKAGDTNKMDRHDNGDQNKDKTTGNKVTKPPGAAMSGPEQITPKVRDRGDQKHNNMMNNNSGRQNSTTSRSNTTHNTRTTHAKVDITKYRRTVTAKHHFSIGIYHAPRDYSYRRWSVGARLPSEYFARNYWLSDYSDYDLITPPDGYVWVRFGPDALLIDEDDGEVVQVVYGIFS